MLEDDCRFIPPEQPELNDGIPKSLCSLKYPSVDNALHYIRSFGPGTLLLKVDLKSAYRIVPVHPLDRHLLGLCWEDRIYVDQALPFGLRSSPLLFTAVADAIGWVLMRSGITCQIHYLDDFLFFFPPSSRLRGTLLQHVLGIMGSLGVPVAFNKVEGPATSITFLGIRVDTVRFELRLPAEKIEFICELVRSWRGRSSGRASDFDSLLGHLLHAAPVIRQGRTFLRHLYDIQAEMPSPHHFIHLDAKARADLLWWEFFFGAVEWDNVFQTASYPWGPCVY